jgi:hypothetical protein
MEGLGRHCVLESTSLACSYDPQTDTKLRDAVSRDGPISALDGKLEATEPVRRREHATARRSGETAELQMDSSTRWTSHAHAY